MFSKLQPVWLIARRELHDQLRDWRVLVPMMILTLSFPFLMNAFAQQTIDFLNQYEANLIIDRLVPASIMIIGFFPITVSLVVALESFVGEKERGTIEPLLTAPFDDWQLYFGKLLVGVATPLFSSYLSIGMYLFMVARRDLTMPSTAVLVQLVLLTTAHAFLMVSAAIVISVQSTTVKAANLLASFIVIPMAILMQGEAVMLFWGNESILWMAIVGVTILSLLLIRVGIAHFEREYLLGREIDNLNFPWIMQKLMQGFLGGAVSIRDWYGRVLSGALRRTLPAIGLLVFMALVCFWASYGWVTENMAGITSGDLSESLERLLEANGGLPDPEELTAPALFLNNSRVMVASFMLGLFSFSVLGVLVFLINISLVGGVFALIELTVSAPVPFFLAGILPHGIFEIPALLFGSAVVLYMGAGLVTPQTGKSMGEVVIELVADWLKIFLGLVIPLLAIAALVEAYITPVILLKVIGN